MQSVWYILFFKFKNPVYDKFKVVMIDGVFFVFFWLKT